MHYYYILFFILQCSNLPSNADISQSYSNKVDPGPDNCTTILEAFAKYASNFTMCSILHARPIKLCEKCIDEYMNFHKQYKLLTDTINGTSCKDIYISQDRLDAVLEYHDNILSIWNKGQCYACYDWSNTSQPVLSNETKNFITLFNETDLCIKKYGNPSNSSEVCDKCMQDYVRLDNYYKTLSEDAIGVDSICMDVVDSMNHTRSVWSKTYDCCKVRRTPEVIFLCSAGIISALPLLYYFILRYCSPIRDFPNVLKQSRFKQTILRALNRRIN